MWATTRSAGFVRLGNAGIGDSELLTRYKAINKIGYVASVREQSKLRLEYDWGLTLIVDG
jgi:hypothetical protein